MVLNILGPQEHLYNHRKPDWPYARRDTVATASAQTPPGSGSLDCGESRVHQSLRHLNTEAFHRASKGRIVQAISTWELRRTSVAPVAVPPQALWSTSGAFAVRPRKIITTPGWYWMLEAVSTRSREKEIGLVKQLAEEAGTAGKVIDDPVIAEDAQPRRPKHRRRTPNARFPSP